MQSTLDFAPRRIRIDGTSTPDEIAWFHDVYSREMTSLALEPFGDAPFVFDSTIRSPLSQGMATYSRSGRPDAAGALAMRKDAAIFGLRIARRLLAPLIDGYDALGRTNVPPARQPLCLLLAYLDSLQRIDAVVEPGLRRLLACHVADLAALVIGASRDGVAMAAVGGVRAARLAAVKRDIADNIARPDLSEVAVAARHGISPRYLRRLFETEGTSFTEYVLGERLDRAFRILTDPGQVSRTIGEIALASGFGDLSYFNRTFRRRYGDTPSGVRAALRRRS